MQPCRARPMQKRENTTGHAPGRAKGFLSAFPRDHRLSCTGPGSQSYRPIAQQVLKKHHLHHTHGNCESNSVSPIVFHFKRKIFGIRFSWCDKRNLFFLTWISRDWFFPKATKQTAAQPVQAMPPFAWEGAAAFLQCLM